MTIINLKVGSIYNPVNPANDVVGWEVIVCLRIRLQF